MIVWDADDFGCNHIISDMCQSHDCRDQLEKFKAANPNFKATLFAIPGEMTPELLNWVSLNRKWVELGVHGFYHTSNYECHTMSYEEFDENMRIMEYRGILPFYVNGFKAPGWQISDGIYAWLVEHNWWVADQAYNDSRRPTNLRVYKVGENSSHHHTWDCVGNGVYEQEQLIIDRIKDEKVFKFISEVAR
jgi:hypothetical protein